MYPGLLSAGIFDQDEGLELAKGGEQFGDLLVGEVWWDVVDDDLVGAVLDDIRDNPLLVLLLFDPSSRGYVVFRPGYLHAGRFAV